jgi:hypothetical protein
MADRALYAEVWLLAKLAEVHNPAFEESAGGGGDDAEEPREELSADQTARHELDGALAAADAAGLLSGERAEWLRDLDAHFAEPIEAIELTDEPTGRMEAHLAALDGEQRFEAAYVLRRLGIELLDEDARDDVCVEYESPELLELKAVLPGPPVAKGGARVFSVECYDGGVLVRWELARPIPEELGPPSVALMSNHLHRLYTGIQPPRLSDDADTAYVNQGGGGGGYLAGDSWVIEQRMTFAPGVPSGATTLSVELDGGSFGFDVTRVAERPGL